MTDVLKVQDLSVVFSGRRKREDVKALDGLSFSVAKGESLSIIGESGSGKTTLMRSILGHVAPSQGTVFLFGKNMYGISRQERIALRRRCGMISQDPYGSLPPTLTVLEAVMEPWLLVKGRSEWQEGERRARSLLKEIGLEGEDLLSSKVRLSLSGGQRQRVAIARGLILQPELLLCDEPTSMQDASTRGEILAVFQRRQEEGMSMIFVTHDLFLARKAARRGIVLHRGVLVEEGLCTDLLTAPQHSYTKALVAALPRLTEPKACPATEYEFFNLYKGT